MSQTGAVDSQLAEGRQSASRPARPLTRTQEVFCLEYLASGYNATAAYKKSHPRCTSSGAARVQAHRLLTNPNIQWFLSLEHESRRARLRMEADEALALISIVARADVRDIFDDDGKVLQIQLWPDSIRLAVKSIRSGPFGPAITFYDGLRARELMAIAAGRLTSPHQPKHQFDHARHLEDTSMEERTSQDARQPPIPSA